MVEQISAILHNVLALTALLYLVCCRWRAYRIDLLRYKLFCLRDELFSLAVQEGIDFDDPTYGTLRGMLNRQIRYAHRLSGVSAVLAALTQMPAIEHRMAGFDRRLEEYPEDIRERLAALRRRMGLTLMKHVAVTSPCLIAFLALTYVRAYWRGRQIRHMHDVMQPALEALDSQAEEMDREALLGVAC